MIGVVERIVAGGEGLVRIDGEAVLVRSVVPGDRVELRPLGRRRGATRAELVRVVDASADRITAPCPVVEVCGGCPLMALSAPAQARAKEEILRRALGNDAAIRPIRVPPAPLAYRNRVRLRWNRGRVGYARAGSQDIVDVEGCAVLVPTLAPVLSIVRGLVPSLGPAGEARAVTAKGGRIALAIRPARDPSAALFRAVEDLVAGGALSGAVVVSAGTSRAEIGDATGEVLGGDGLPIEVDADGFAQPCDALVPSIASDLLAALDASPRDHVLELHAGAGTWTVALARAAGSFMAVDEDVRAVERLRTNLAGRDLRTASVRRESAADAVASPGRKPTLVVLDPPRTGAAEVVASLAALGARRIAYLSCDPATLGRDARTLQGAGYRLASVQPYDLMPQTAEVEALALFEGPLSRAASS